MPASRDRPVRRPSKICCTSGRTDRQHVFRIRKVVHRRPLAQSPSAKNVTATDVVAKVGSAAKVRRRPLTGSLTVRQDPQMVAQVLNRSFYTERRMRSKGGTLGPSGDRRMVRGSEVKGGYRLGPSGDRRMVRGSEAKGASDPYGPFPGQPTGGARKRSQRVTDPWSLRSTDGWCEEAKSKGYGSLVPPVETTGQKCEEAKQRGDPWSLRRPTGGVRWNARALGASERSCIIAERLALCIRDVPRSSPCASTIRFAAVEILIVGRRQTEGCRTSERPNMSARRSTGRFRTSAERLALCIRDVPRSSPCALHDRVCSRSLCRRPRPACPTAVKDMLHLGAMDRQMSFHPHGTVLHCAQSPSAKNVTAIRRRSSKVGVRHAKVVGDR